MHYNSIQTNWKVTGAPGLEPVTLAEMKLHLRATEDTTDNDLITSLIIAARQWCEGYQNRAYISQTITLKSDRFPKVFYIPRPLLISVTSIKYIDTAGVEQTLSTDVYDTDIYSQPGRIGLKYGQSWPAIRGDINSVEIIYKAGYGEATADVPDGIKAAIKLLAAHLYVNRIAVCDSSMTEVPLAVRSLLAMDKTL